MSWLTSYLSGCSPVIKIGQASSSVFPCHCCIRFDTRLYLFLSLLNQLSTSFGFSGPTMSWLTSYLSGCSPVIKIGQASSSVFPCHCCIRFDTRLYLFSVYMSLILQIASTRSVAVQQYADAVSTATLPTAQARLEHCTADLDAWFHFNGLCLNPIKSEAILLGTCQHLLSFPTVPSVNIASCPVTDQITTLSVIADKHFTFDSHVSALCQKLRHICSFLREDMAASIASTKCFYCIALYCVICLQCFDAVGWAAGRASGL